MLIEKANSVFMLFKSLLLLKFYVFKLFLLTNLYQA